MSFDSPSFIVLLVSVLAIYYLAPRKVRLPLLIAASIIFYCWWEWSYFFLIIFSTLVDWTCVRQIVASQDPRHRKRWVVVSVVTNLTMLCVFKYTNFFVSTVRDATGGDWPPYLNVLLPVGISFYTFQTMSYTIDVYRGRMHPARSLPSFFLFVCFVPQLVAGPIERAKSLLPQLRYLVPRVPCSLRNLAPGAALVAWGLVKKVLIGDRLAVFVAAAYDQPDLPSGATILLGTYCFAFQLFFDFSAYSDIARGSALMLGIKLSVNFNLPFLARNPPEFWRRWHITLYTWFRDYLYIPLGGNRGGVPRKLLNALIVLFLAGLWHGAQWHFAVYGLWFWAAIVVYIGLRERVGPARVLVPRLLRRPLSILITFHVVVVAFALFRASTVTSAVDLLGVMLADPGATLTGLAASGTSLLLIGLAAGCFALMFIEERFDLMQRLMTRDLLLGFFLAGSVLALLLLRPALPVRPAFIYFQF